LAKVSSENALVIDPVLRSIASFSKEKPAMIALPTLLSPWILEIVAFGKGGADFHESGKMQASR
jgi:hypothetical protein